MPSKQLLPENTPPAAAPLRVAGKPSAAAVAAFAPSASASAARARENQRASRARRRELVESLRSRIDEYERRGVQATLEMQQAARAVAQENRRLRALLAHHGIPEAEVQRFLLGDSDSPQSATSPSMAAELATPTAASLDVCRTPPVEPRGRCGPTSVSSVPSTARGFEIPVTDDAGQAVSCCGRKAPQSTCGSGTQQTASNCTAKSAPPAPEPPPPQTVVTHLQPLESALETDCDKAATILAEIQGHSDLQLARQALGCEGSGPCSAKNMRVLELLNDVT